MAGLLGAFANIGSAGGLGPLGQTFGAVYNGLNNAYSQAQQQPKGKVLGASTTNTGGYSSSGGTRTTSVQGTPAASNPNDYLQPTPGFQMPDYNAIIQPAMDALNGAVAPAQSAYQSALTGIDSNVQQSKNSALDQQSQALDTANTQQTNLQNQAEQQVNQQRQGAADTVRGLQAQFGGTSSTGGYLGEQAYRGSLQNIGQIHTGLDNAIQQVNNQISNVKNVTASTLKDIDSQAATLKSSAQSQLDQQLQQIRMAQGQLQSQKAELTAQALQNYQAVVNQVNAQNAQYKQNLAIQSQRAQELLTSYGQKVTAAKSQLQSVSLGIDPQSGSKLVGTFDKSAGQYFDQNGQPIGGSVVGGGAQPTAGGSLGSNNLSQDNIQRLNGLFGS